MGDRSTMSSSVATNALVRTSRGSREHHLTKAMLENNMRVRSLQKTGRGGDHSGDHDQRSVRIGLEAALKNHVSVCLVPCFQCSPPSRASTPARARPVPGVLRLMRHTAWPA